jgi:outer membrane immunogenic protein
MRYLSNAALGVCVGLVSTLGLGLTSAAAQSPKGSTPGYNWSGYYIGAHVGGGSSNVDWTYLASGNTADHDGSGAFGGIQAGYNLQSGALVYGIEGDLSLGSIDGSPPCPNPAWTCATDISRLASLRLRAGVAMDSWLLYATGGLGYGAIDVRTSNGAADFGSEKSRLGWTVGGGIEYGIGGGWSIKAEYLYYDLGSNRSAVDVGLIVDTDVTVHTGKFGVNIRF